MCYHKANCWESIQEPYKRVIILARINLEQENMKIIKPGTDGWKAYLFCLCFILIGLGCKPEAGEGGTSSIYGKVMVKDLNSSFILTGEYPGADEDVYIIYGDDISYGDRVRTNYNGEYEFKYLNKGKYRIYMYSEDSVYIQGSSGDFAVIRDAEITSRKQKVEVPLMTVYR